MPLSEKEKRERNRLRSIKHRKNRTPEQKLVAIEKRKKRYWDNSEDAITKSKEYYKANKKQITKKSKSKYNKNKDEINKKRREKWANQSFEERQIALLKRNDNQSKRKQNDPAYKLSALFRSRVSRAIKEGYGEKSYKVIELLGCDWNTAKEWIESKWKKGMNWKNHGLHTWHIDHILPVDSFDMTCVEQQKRCFHYTNLQPMWAKDNLLKSNKLL